MVRKDSKWKNTRSVGLSGKYKEQTEGLYVWIGGSREEHYRVDILQQTAQKVIWEIYVFIPGPSTKRIQWSRRAPVEKHWAISPLELKGNVLNQVP